MMVGVARMRLVLLVSLVAVGLGPLVHGQATPLSPGDQAKVTVSLDTAQIALDGVEKYLNKQAESLKALDSAVDRAKHLQNILKFARGISKLMQAVSAVAAIFSIISTFFMPSQLDVIKEHFDVVNQKLDGITLQINHVRDELKSSIEFNTWLATYIEWELDILNGEAKLLETQDRLIRLEDEGEKLKIMKTFVDYFENSDIEGKAMKIHQLTAISSTTTKSNLFDLFVTEKGCDVAELSRLMFIIRDLMTSAAKQTVIYQFVKHGRVDYAREKMAEFYVRLYEIRRQFDIKVWYCQRDSDKNAKKEAQKLIETKNGASKKAQSKAIKERLSHLMPWYDWAVVFYKQAPSVTIKFKQGCKDVTVTFSDLGGQFFTLEKVGGNEDTNLLVVWQDSEDKAHGCQDTAKAHTFVPFQVCSDCSKDVLTASNNILTGNKCFNYLTNFLFGKNPICVINSETSVSIEHAQISKTIDEENYLFVAAGFSSPQNPCPEACNNHGMCQHIPDTSSHLCLCHDYYEGSQCQEYHNPATTDKITDMVAILRQGFSTFIGVPTVIDVYMIIREIPQQIIDSVKYTQIVSRYGPVFSDARYIAVVYNQLQSGEISEQTFSSRVASTNFHRIISELKDAILGKGILIQQNFLTAYKKSFISESGSQLACTERYSKIVSHMRKNLVTLDEAVTEARLWYLRWQIQQLTGPEDNDIVDGAQRILKAAQSRRNEYAAHWEATSCPKLTAVNLHQRYCDARDSYQGLQLSLTCANQKRATPSKVSCTSKQGKLQWTAKPQCVYMWGSWSPWSGCSKTCGRGQRTRQRSKPNGQKDKKAQPCNTHECCQARDGKFKCSNGRCVTQSKVCDGNNDCGDRSDEPSRCTYLRVGNTIALKSSVCGTFLSCYGTGPSLDSCKMQNCPGSDMSGSDWDKCWGEKFNYISAIGRSHGDAIRYGDKIALRYSTGAGDTGWWLSCAGSIGGICGTRSCPGKEFTQADSCGGETFWIYSYHRRGSCGTDTNNGCVGQPLYPGDEVYIKYTSHGNGYWLSGCHLWIYINTKPCPGRYFTQGISQGCGWERWTVYRR